MADKHKYMPIKDFVDEGYLLELNRVFLHPLGLALEVTITGEDDTWHLSGIWDARDDPEGWRYGPFDANAKAKAANIAELREARREPRMEALGYWVEPMDKQPASAEEAT